MTLNAEVLQAGRTRKRRGITTDVSSQVGLTIGTAAPFRYFRWYYPKGEGNCLVAVGSDAIAFVHPYNRFLYARTDSGTDRIYESPTSTVATSWGLSAASGVVSDSTYEPSTLYAGSYLYAVTRFNIDRLVESPPFFVPSITAITPTPHLQWVISPMYSVNIYGSAPSGRIVYRLYRKLFHQATWGGNWLPRPTGLWGLSGLQLVAEIASTASGKCSGVYSEPNTTITATASVFTVSMINKTITIEDTGTFTIVAHISGTQILVTGNATCADKPFSVAGYPSGVPYVDQGMTTEGRLQKYDQAVVPFAYSVVYQHGVWVYGNLPSRPYMFVWSSHQCPETYAGPLSVGGNFFQSTLASTEEGLLQGESSGLIPPDMGKLVGWAAMGYRLLALCENGYYSLDRQPDGVRYAVSKSPGPIGCTANATVCNTPWGVIWLSRDGLALWDGSGAPVVLTQGILDPDDPDMDFADDLSGAMAAYDERRNQYVVVVPTSAGGQTILMLQLDALSQKQIWVSKWTTPISAAVTGLGYDAELGEIVWRFGAASAVLCQADGVYADASKAYAFGVDLWQVAQPSRAEPMSDVMENISVFVIPHREDVTGSQTVAVNIRGMGGLDDGDGKSIDQSLVWPANARKGKITKAQRMSGKVVRVRLRNEDSHPLELVSVRIDQAHEAPTKYDL